MVALRAFFSLLSSPSTVSILKQYWESLTGEKKALRATYWDKGEARTGSPYSSVTAERESRCAWAVKKRGVSHVKCDRRQVRLKPFKRKNSWALEKKVKHSGMWWNKRRGFPMFCLFPRFPVPCFRDSQTPQDVKFYATASGCIWLPTLTRGGGYSLTGAI